MPPANIKGEETDASPSLHTYNRYYHMFDEGELRTLVCGAAEEMGILIGSIPKVVEHYTADRRRRFMYIVQDGWERSNYYLEIRLSEE